LSCFYTFNETIAYLQSGAIPADCIWRSALTDGGCGGFVSIKIVSGIVNIVYDWWPDGINADWYLGSDAQVVSTNGNSTIVGSYPDTTNAYGITISGIVVRRCNANGEEIFE